eukprot:scaffold16860_cov67-Isochrysis_galbana.AAC.1
MQIPRTQGSGCFDVLLPQPGRAGAPQGWAGARCIPAPACPDALAVCANYTMARLRRQLEPQLSIQVGRGGCGRSAAGGAR